MAGQIPGAVLPKELVHAEGGCSKSGDKIL